VPTFAESGFPGFDDFKAEVAKWGKVVRAGNIKAD
jgi:hypothetical protein